MNDSAIKAFCTQAREKLEQGVELRMQKYGIVAEGAPDAAADAVDALPLSPVEREQRAQLLKLQAQLGEGDLSHGHNRLRERAAYTWFNRMIAIRFMELRDYLPSRVRMFSKADGSFGSQAVDEALDVEIEGLDVVRVLQLKQASDDEALFRCLFLAQCQELSHCIPDVFEPVDSALELLLPDKLMARDSVAQAMVEDIPEEDWLAHVEILGWMYQYYNSDAKDAFFKSKAKATADTLPVATQLFTPEWIVRYMVQNSLGRLWMLNNPQSAVRQQMEYYIEPDAQHEDFIHIDGPEEITLCDPACGSGHILVYAFDLLFAMYEERGYREREIPQLILQNNLTGLEIDERAAQIASLALAMCAREHDRRFFSRGVQADINVAAPVNISEEELPQASALLGQPQLLDALAHLDEIGSLLNPTAAELAAVRADADAAANVSVAGDMFAANAAEKLQQAKATCELLSRKYTCVVANPPYMGSSSFSPFMSKWIKKNYPDVKSDLFSSFIVRNMVWAKPHGELGFMTPFVWMFIGSYEKLRKIIVDEKTLTSLIQLEYSGFAGATVPICTFTIHNGDIPGYRGGYVRLSDFVGAANQEPKALEAIADPNCGWFYRRNAETFKQIPGTPIAYWASDALLDAFSKGKELSEIGKPRVGLQTGENARFVREWWEVTLAKSKFDCASINESKQSGCKWFPYNKGGDYRKWYGNNSSVVNWEDDGKEIRAFKNGSGKLLSRPQNTECYFRPSITWSKISSGSIAFRYKPRGHVFDVAGTSIFADEGQLLYLQGACNSSVMMNVASMLSPTLNFEVGQIATYPIIEDVERANGAEELVSEERNLSKLDWDSFETSWDFKRHPLL